LFLSCAIETDALKVTGSVDPANPECADKQITAPRRKSVAGVEGHSRRTDRWNPHDIRRHKIFATDLVRHQRSPVLAPVGNNRPAVVAARQDPVDLVPPHRSVLAGPQLAGVGVDGHAHLVAMSE